MSQSTTEQSHNNGALRARDAAKFLGVAQSTFWRWTAEGKLPRGIRLSSRCTVWRREALEKVLEQSSGQGGTV